MDDGDAILAAILADPADDTPRLVYADWLEENAGEVECGACFGITPHYTNYIERACHVCSGVGHVPDGRHERAEFIRVQVELAGMSNPCSTCGTGDQYRYATESLGCCECSKFRHLRRRERELLTRNYRWIEWAKPWPLISNHVWEWFRRGFLASIVGPWDTWRTHCDAILVAQPIERVRLTTNVDDLNPILGRWPDGYQMPIPSSMRMEEALALAWPRIAFELTAEAVERGRSARLATFIGNSYRGVISLQDARTETGVSPARPADLPAVDAP